MKKLVKTALVGSLAVASVSPFAMNAMAQGYQNKTVKCDKTNKNDKACVANKKDAKKAEAKCGEAKCGGTAKAPTATKKADAKCGEAKCGAAPTTKKADAKCGEAKCGGAK